MQTELPVVYTIGATPFITVTDLLKDDFRFVFTNTLMGNIAKGNGGQVAILEEVFDLDTLAQAQSDTLWLHNKLASELISGSLVALNPDYPALRAPQLQAWLPNTMYESTLYAMNKIIAVEKVVEEHGIDMVLVHEDISIDGRLLADLGHQHGVPVVHIPHANYFISPTEGDIHASSRADALGVYGPYMRDWFIQAGVDPAKITIIGAAHWDILYSENDRITKEHARRCFGLTSERPVYTYAASWSQNTNAWGRGEEDLFNSLHWVLDTARATNAQVIIKLHPHQSSDSANMYLSLAEKAGVKVIATTAYTPHTIKAADVVITQGSSNLAVEAGILGVPTVEMYQPGTKYPAKYNIPGTWGEDLLYMIDTAISAGVSREFIADMNMGPGSGERMRAFVKGQLDD